MKKTTIFTLQLASVLMIWLFVGSLTGWILHLIEVAMTLHDVPDASIGISIVAIPVFVTIAGVLTYVFVGLNREDRE